MGKQRDGPDFVIRLGLALLQSVLIDITIALVFLGLGAFIFGPNEVETFKKVVVVLIVSVLTLFISCSVVILRIIFELRKKSKDRDSD